MGSCDLVDGRDPVWQHASVPTGHQLVGDDLYRAKHINAFLTAEPEFTIPETMSKLVDVSVSGLKRYRPKYVPTQIAPVKSS